MTINELTIILVSGAFLKCFSIYISSSYRDMIVKQSCYFEKVCDHEFNKKEKRVYLFSLQEIDNFALKRHKRCFEILGITA